MRLLDSALLLAGISSFAETGADAIADRMLIEVDHAAWGAPYVASKSAGCQPRTPSQQVFGANDQWSESCTSHVDGLIDESYFFVFDASGPVRLRMEIRPEPPANVEVAQALRERLTKRFGTPTHEANLMEVGLPFAGDHWSSSKLHYYLFQSPIGMHPGVRGPVQLIAIDSRLFREIRRNAFVQQADVLFYPDPPARPFLQQLLGDDYTRLIDAAPKTPSEVQSLAQQASSEAFELLDVASRALLDEKAMLLLAVNGLVTKLSTLLWEVNSHGDSETSAAGPIRKQLAKFGVNLGGNLHDGGLAYNQDLLWRVQREFPDSQAGQLAFLELQQRGWSTGQGPGCPANPDLFREVIEHGEAFLAQHPSTQFRKEVLFTLAVANESWWSVARAPADDGWVSGIPYPRKDLNQRQAGAARDRAIHYYEEIVKLAPESPEAASAERRLPRLKLGLDTGQRRFFCSFD
jgi:hypothetical protein